MSGNTISHGDPTHWASSVSSKSRHTSSDDGDGARDASEGVFRAHPGQTWRASRDVGNETGKMVDLAMKTRPEARARSSSAVRLTVVRIAGMPQGAPACHVSALKLEPIRHTTSLLKWSRYPYQHIVAASYRYVGGLRCSAAPPLSQLRKPPRPRLCYLRGRPWRSSPCQRSHPSLASTTPEIVPPSPLHEPLDFTTATRWLPADRTITSFTAVAGAFPRPSLFACDLGRITADLMYAVARWTASALLSQIHSMT